MSDYDLQFQADLEKAQELSLESLALEQFRRQKIAHNDSTISRDIAVSFRRRDEAEGGTPPALPPPPRGPSRGRPSTPTGDTDDLISFSSPTSKTAPKGPHEALIDQLNKLNPQEETPVNSTPDGKTMSNNYYNNRPPGYQYSPQYTYPYQPPYPPYPTGSPYGMPSPISTPVQNVQNYVYYTPPPMIPPSPNTPIYGVPYQQTRMSSPYLYAPQQYNYNTTNMISRPTRPVVYPPNHSYPPTVPNAGVNSNVVNNNVKATESQRESPENVTKPEYMRKVSEISNVSNESSDTLGSLPDMNLIDFGKRNGGSSQGSVRVSVLEAFDPLLTDQNIPDYSVGSECSSSVYEEYDPLDFLYSETEMRDAPVYATISKKEKATLPSPPPKSIPSVPAVPKPNTTDKLYDCIVKLHTREFDNEHKAFLKMVIDVRNQFDFKNEQTNPGHVIAARSEGKYPPHTSIKLLVHHAHAHEPITFTSDVESTVEHVILTVVCSLDEDIREDMSGYMLRVWGANEYLTPGSSLSEYDYVRACFRLEKDVRLSLHRGKDSTLARSERDDARDAHLTLEDIVPSYGAGPSLTFDSLSILLETLEGELSRAIGIISAEGVCSPNGVLQAVKAICALAGGVETLYVTHTISAFSFACCGQNTNQTSKPEIVSESGAYSSVVVRPASRREALSARAGRVRDAVRALLGLYVRTARHDLALAVPPAPTLEAVPAHTISETTLFCIEALHALPLCWSYDEYVFHVQVYYGTRPIKVPRTTHTASLEHTGFYPRILFDTWINLDDVPINTLPREGRLVLTLYGRTQKPLDGQNQPTDAGQNNQNNGENVFIQYEEKELGWTAIQMFDYDGILANGNYILPIWPTSIDKRIGPAPNLYDRPSEPHPLVNIEIPLYTHSGVKWCVNENDEKSISRKDLPKFDSLDGHTQLQLMHVIEQGGYNRMCPEEREKLWEKRQYLVELPGALPLVLLAATNWYGEHRSSLLALMDVWETPSPLNAMHLLLPCFPDSEVRALAVRLISKMSDDELCRVLPQLCQALRHEQHEASPLAQMLLRRSLASPTVAHKLFWLLVHSLPNISQFVTDSNHSVRLITKMSDDEFCRVLPQLCQALRHEQHEASPLAQMLLRRSLASPTVAHKLFWLLVHSLTNVSQKSNEEYLGISLEDSQPPTGTNPSVPSSWRYSLLLRTLLAVTGTKLANVLWRQGLLVKMLSEVAQSVKSAKEGVRQRALVAGVELIASAVRTDAICLPLGLARTVHDVDIKSCSYFNSNTLPLKINFIGSDNAVIPAMFKVGDDLRQDALVLQVMRVMDSLWLKAGLDLRMVTFQAVPTNERKGMIEIVSEAETLRAIQTEWGLTGSFKDKPIAEWLAKHNPSELEYQRARDNFTASCAGYSVATYLLGICDRHNDNIMLKTSGHLFHIDFGKFLGDAQMFGNFKRDRAPFVLTHDMVYVINGGDRPTQKFHHFVELCCMAFNIVRAHHDHILDLFALMSLSGVPGVTSAAVGYVRSALLLGSTNAEAAAAFARLITSSLKSKFTPINFFLHNLAQFRASGDQSNNTTELLTFMPRTYTMSQESRIERVEVLTFEKRYDPEKHYVYVLRVYRQGQPAPTVLYRSYKHFTELYQKICLHFPLAKVHRVVPNIIGVEMLIFEKRYDPEKHYAYVLRVYRQPAPTVLYRSYKHFTELYQKICIHFPLAKVHSLPSGLHVGRSNIRQVAERRFGDVQAFLMSLFSLAEEIAHSDLVYTFFHPLLRDQQDVEPQRMKNPSSECEDRGFGCGAEGSLKLSVQYVGGVLAVLILHAQSLPLPQGLPPNPYVKVYLVPDPTKETKRKTRVMKKNAHPSFMEMLEYRLPIDVVKSRILRATVWHHDPLQENQFLGGVEIPLATLPLRKDTVGWYPLQYLPR